MLSAIDSEEFTQIRHNQRVGNGQVLLVSKSKKKKLQRGSPVRIRKYDSHLPFDFSKSQGNESTAYAVEYCTVQSYF